ncbi:Vacuolar ATP synthase catalytic subunit A [Spironucleus salmonicida]|uniref:H(+)-transporting two-sector ATPase n=1 Tax=Spironucleus salmonicida TaxID=348837 RepID=V6LVP9_9EUKA|nr:Vacuolar ATP synthase catalytic subunit A [Spironucleus salmonicida]|eukprot:EST48697.1 Vacuolar ATP synthase catalytic subunit A [Spironucleus salmonicida]
MNTNSTVISVSGPVVRANNLLGAFLYEVVYVGDLRLIGEIIQLSADQAVIQVYEETSGLRVGQPVYRSAKLLSVELGPGLLTTIYDGIQRPLVDIAVMQAKRPLHERSDTFIPRGVEARALNANKKWYVDLSRYNVKVGNVISQGDFYGAVQENKLLECRLFVPSYGIDKETKKEVICPGGTVTFVAESGLYNIDAVVLEIKYQNQTIQYTLSHKHPVRSPAGYAQKLPAACPLITGQRVLDGIFPVAQGSTAAIPGAFGCGKTVISQAVSKFSNSDVIVYIGCGERGNEMAEVLTEFPEMDVEVEIGTCIACGVEKRVHGDEKCMKCGKDLKIEKSSASIMDRTVLIANTSNMPVAAREASIYTGITISEYFRDMGYHVSLLADSTSRWAEALREISGRLAELPSEGGYPSYLSSRLSQFYERAGRVICLGQKREGSITIIGAVSPQGGDFSDAVAVNTLQIVAVFWALSKNLAKRKHFPSVDWTLSYSRCIDGLSKWFSPEFLRQREILQKLLQDEISLQETAQLVGFDSLGGQEKLILETCRIVKEGFLQQNSFSSYDKYCPFEKTCGMMGNLVVFYELAYQKIEKGADFNTLKTDAQDIITELYRMKFIDSNEHGLEYAIAEIEKLKKKIVDVLGSEL